MQDAEESLSLEREGAPGAGGASPARSLGAVEVGARAPQRVRGWWLWALLAYVSLALGIIGIVVPVLPTVPFILLSAFAAARGSLRLRRWLLSHPRFAQAITDWERDGMVARRAKWLATSVMVGSAAVLFVATPRWWGAGCATATMVAVGTWLWLRPEPPSRERRGP